ncbi:MAG: exopolyphosphatase [Sulfurimonas sp.]|nr:exopolyphosphatase [Sulfurimonas sp.]
MSGKFRLVTRSDMDGIATAIILTQLELVDEIKFVHPKDVQDGIVDITENDIITNLPHPPKAYLVFDHYKGEAVSNEKEDSHLIMADTPSAAREVYNYYLKDNDLSMIRQDMLLAVDKCDAAQFSKEEILNPKAWVLLHFLMDARTGLGRFINFEISNYNLMLELIDYCHDHGIDDVMLLPHVKERVDLYNKHADTFKEQLKRCATVYENLVVLDLRDEEIIYPGNRFMIYVLFPQVNISIHVLWGLKKQNTVFATGKSIINKSSKTNIGELMHKYAGGGHKDCGTCQVEHDKAKEVLSELITAITQDG